MIYKQRPRGIQKSFLYIYIYLYIYIPADSIRDLFIAQTLGKGHSRFAFPKGHSTIPMGKEMQIIYSFLFLNEGNLIDLDYLLLECFGRKRWISLIFTAFLSEISSSTGLSCFVAAEDSIKSSECGAVLAWKNLSKIAEMFFLVRKHRGFTVSNGLFKVNTRKIDPLM